VILMSLTMSAAPAAESRLYAASFRVHASSSRLAFSSSATTCLMRSSVTSNASAFQRSLDAFAQGPLPSASASLGRQRSYRSASVASRRLTAWASVPLPTRLHIAGSGM
jgi:hypothetical protein